MIGLYLFFKMMAVLIVAMFWFLVGTAYVLFWMVVGLIIGAYWLLVGIGMVIGFIVGAVKAVREHRREQRLITA